VSTKAMRFTLKGKDLKKAIRLWLEAEGMSNAAIASIMHEYNPVEVELTVEVDRGG
jgi:hypothetical protein